MFVISFEVSQRSDFEGGGSVCSSSRWTLTTIPVLSLLRNPVLLLLLPWLPRPWSHCPGRLKDAGKASGRDPHCQQHPRFLEPTLDHVWSLRSLGSLDYPPHANNTLNTQRSATGEVYVGSNAGGDASAVRLGD